MPEARSTTATARVSTSARVTAAAPPSPAEAPITAACSLCGTITTLQSLRPSGGGDRRIICVPCFNSLPTCSHCHQTHWRRNITNGLCVTCTSTVSCSRCGNGYAAYRMIRHAIGRYCLSCNAALEKCSRCDRVIDTAGDRIALVDEPDGEKYYCRDCFHVPSRLDPTTYKRNPFTRDVGFELEFIAARNTAVWSYGNIHGDGSIAKQKDDPDESKDVSRFYEFAAARTSGDRLLDLIDKSTAAIRRGRGYVNRTCGFHAHFDMRQSTSRDRLLIMYWWRMFEDIMYSMVSPTRRNNQYCRRVKEIDDVTWREVRYHGLNIAALSKYSSFEVRIHHGTINAKKIKNWIMFLLHFFDKMPKLDPMQYGANVRGMTPRQRIIFLWQALGLPLHLRKDMLYRIRAYHKKNPILAYPIK